MQSEDPQLDPLREFLIRQSGRLMKHGVKFTSYWLDEKKGKVFCLSEAPTMEAAKAVHKEAGHPTDERVWITSQTFAKVLQQYGRHVGLPTHHPRTWVRRLSQGIEAVPSMLRIPR